MHIIENPVIPMSAPIMEGFKRDSTIEIFGEIYAGQQGGFSLDFLSLKGAPFHMSVRMGLYNSGPSTIVFNHLKNGKWHKEEHHHNHFHIGRPFHMRIENIKHHFRVHVDGNHICNYHQCQNPKKIHALTIRGDVRIGKVHFEGFKHHNGGGVQYGTGVAVAAPPTVIIQQQPMQIYPSLQTAQVGVTPSAPLFYHSQPEVVVVNGGHHC